MSPPTAAVVKFTKHKNTSKKFFNYNVVWPNWKENYYKYNFSLLYFFSNKDIGQTMFGLWYLLQIHILPTLRNPVVPPPPPFSPGIWKLTFWSIFFLLTIISRVVRHPDSGWTLSETGEEQAGLRHFMGQIRHLAGRRRSTKRLQLSHVDRTGQTTEEASEAF